jgi:hypothetical protein
MMNASKLRLEHIWTSLFLALPALLVCLSEALYLGLKWEGGNNILVLLQGYPPGRILLSPTFLLGGASLCLLLNLARICSVSWETIHDTWVFCVSVRPIRGSLVLVAVGSLLVAVLLISGFLDHFQITAR